MLTPGPQKQTKHFGKKNVSKTLGNPKNLNMNSSLSVLNI